MYSLFFETNFYYLIWLLKKIGHVTKFYYFTNIAVNFYGQLQRDVRKNREIARTEFGRAWLWGTKIRAEELDWKL
jgi:hypothetical protein